MREDGAIGEGDAERIRRVLEQYNALAGAKLNLLIDRGRAVARAGVQTSFAEDVLVSAVGASLNATRELARVLGEDQFSLPSYQGKNDHLQLALIAGRCVLATVFDDGTTAALVKLYGGEAAKKIALILSEAGGGEEAAGAPARLPPKPQGPGAAHA